MARATHAGWVGRIACALVLSIALPIQAAEEEEEQLAQTIAGEESSEDDLLAEFDLLMEEEIVYSAAKHQQYIAESPSAISVITREQIENTHCTEIVCLLRQIPGAMPRLDAVPDGCAFNPRCPHATDKCRQAPVPRVSNGQAACWYPLVDEKVI